MGRTPPGETRRKVFRFMKERLSAGRPPTVREVQEAFGFRAVQTAMEHLRALVDEGLLVHEKGKARGFRLPGSFGSGGRRPTPILVPLLGRVPAGPLDLAVEDHEGTIPIAPRRGRKAGEFFGLRVEGESMQDAGILPGDVVIVRRQAKAEPGDIVVALVGEEATVKRFVRTGGGIELHPENPAFEPIRPDPRELKILGKVVEVRRYLEGPVS